MMFAKNFWIWPWTAVLIAVVLLAPRTATTNSPDISLVNAIADAPAADLDRSPIDLVIAPDESWAVSVNSTSGTASLIDLTAVDKPGVAKILDEQPVGELPSAAALLPDGKHVLVSAARSGSVALFEVAAQKLKQIAVINVGHEPRGIAVAPDGKLAYVALTVEDKVAVVDLSERKKVADIPVGRW